MRVLVACEFSGVVRDAFRDRGHDAVSCDVLPTETDGPHFQRDVLSVPKGGWDLVIAHPPCTYLTNSGVRWLHERPGRWQKMIDAARFFRRLLTWPAPFVAVENPIPHKYAVEAVGRKYDQIVRPWQFGNPESKSICLWLKNLPHLEPTNVIEDRVHNVHRASPGPDRWKERSRFFPEVAAAMADQWGALDPTTVTGDV